MRVLELGQYVAPAYAGLMLAKQGHDVEKWWSTNDPILGLRHGDELWAWLNVGKSLVEKHAAGVASVDLSAYDVVIDNFRADAWDRWEIDPEALVEQYGVTWVSLRDDFDGRSFDAIAQMRAWGDLGSLPFYIGDTAAGLMIAFKACAAAPGHHYVVRQAAALAALVEGGVERRDWDEPGTYMISDFAAQVLFRDEMISEVARDDEWRRTHLQFDGTHFVV